MDTHSTANLPPLAILKKIKFFRKTHLFFQKKIERFEKSYYFSRILRQTHYNLVKKITFRNVNKLADVAWTQLANIG